jgi:hypothetical protein
VGKTPNPKPEKGAQKAPGAGPEEGCQAMGAKEIETLPVPFTTKIVKLLEKNAFNIVVHAIEMANSGDFHAMKMVFDLLEKFEEDAPEQPGSMAKVLLMHLGLTEEMITAEQRAFENGEDPGKPASTKLADHAGVK